MNEKGFTLVEIIAVIAILSLLIVLCVPTVENVSEKMKESNYNQIITSLKSSLRSYVIENDMDRIKPEGYSNTDSCIYYKIDDIVNGNLYHTDNLDASGNMYILNPVTNNKLIGGFEVKFSDSKTLLSLEYYESMQHACGIGEIK